MIAKNSITACLVVYNEEQIIERCLESVIDLVDEIVVVHDGECSDKTLEICKKYTDKIFVKDHVGIAEPLRSFSYEQATMEWILQIDADEFFEKEDVDKIKSLVNDESVDGYWLRWELWNGKAPVRLEGLQKMCLFRKSKARYQGLPQAPTMIDGTVRKSSIVLCHRPAYDNTSWSTANRKRKYWLESHVRYFFPELVIYSCFNVTIDSWLAYSQKVRSHPAVYIIFYPLKNLLGQLKNGLWKSGLGISLALQQYVYYFSLYWQVWQMDKKLKSH